MSQAFLFFALYSVGVSTCLACGLGRRPILCCALGFAIGLSVMVAVVLLMLLARVPYTGLTGRVAALLVVAGNAYALARQDAAGRPARRDWIRIAWWSGAFLVLLFPLTYANLSFLTYDSHYMIILGGAIFDDHALRSEIAVRLSEYGVFHALIESASGFTRQSYLYSLSLVMGLTTAAAFAVLLWHGLTALGASVRHRARWIMLVTATTFTVYMLWRHCFYVHNNLGTATYMFLTLALFWLAEVERDPRVLPLAFVSLLALSLYRIENPIISAIFLAMIVPRSKLPARALVLGLAAHAAVITAWYLHLAIVAPVDSQFLTPMKCFATIAITLALVTDVAVLFAWRWSWLEALNRWLPQLIAGVVVLATIAAFTARPDYMWTNTDTWYRNLASSTYWEGVWLAIGGIALVGVFAPGPPARAVFVYGLPVYFVLNLIFVYGRVPFREAVDDSASRMAIHLIPIVFFYFGVKFIPLLVEATPRTAE